MLCKTVHAHLHDLSVCLMGRFPNEDECALIDELYTNHLSQGYDEIKHEFLLQSIYYSMPVDVFSLASSYSLLDRLPYVRTGSYYQHLGFQSPDPIRDLRGSGVLGLENMLYFIQTYPNIVYAMIKKHSRRDNKSVAHEGYPWAAAGINITRLLALEFELIQVSGMKTKSENYTRKIFWHYLVEPEGFNRMYVCMFLLLDHYWDLMNATYMQFPNVLKRTQEEFHSLLQESTSLSQLETTIFDIVNVKYDIYSLPLADDESIFKLRCDDCGSLEGMRRRSPFTVNFI